VPAPGLRDRTAGGGLVLTRHHEGNLAGGTVYALPAAEFLGALDTPSLAPSRS